LSLKDAENSQYPYQAYSAKFTLNEMDGTFNATILAAISTDTSNSAVSSASVGYNMITYSIKTDVQASSTKAATSSTVSRPAVSATTSTKSNGAASTVVSSGLIAGLVGLAAYIAL
jgi:hypothetical protein